MKITRLRDYMYAPPPAATLYLFNMETRPHKFRLFTYLQLNYAGCKEKRERERETKRTLENKLQAFVVRCVREHACM